MATAGEAARMGDPGEADLGGWRADQEYDAPVLRGVTVVNPPQILGPPGGRPAPRWVPI